MNLSNCYYKCVLTGILFVPAIFFWRRLYRNYISLRKKYKDEKGFQDRHNCVIMYSRGCIRGWPDKSLIKINISNIQEAIQPYLYFINTAKSNLDIAMMKIAINPLLQALQEAAARGIKVRLIINFLSVKSVSEECKALLKSGVRIAFYVDKSGALNNIMHCKYMVKDYDKMNGYLCVGSMNWTGFSSILNNYEDVTFTSSVGVAGTFHESFEECWNLISRDNESAYNKSVLSQFNFG